MASSNSSTKINARSISLPSRPHPTALKLEHELSKLEPWFDRPASTSGSIVSGLSMPEDLYACLEEFLNTESTKRAVLHFGGRRECPVFDEILDASITLLDIYGSVRDMVERAKEHVRALRSVVGRMKWDPRVVPRIAEYVKFRKKAKKDAKRLFTTLKRANTKLVASSSIVMLDRDHDFSRVFSVLREVYLTSIATLRSVVDFLRGPAAMKPRSGGWRVISRLFVHKGVVGCDEELGVLNNNNELESIDESLRSVLLLIKKKGIREALSNKMINEDLNRQLGDLEVSIGSIEEGLEGLFRRLIRSRVSLLNILSQ